MLELTGYILDSAVVFWLMINNKRFLKLLKFGNHDVTLDKESTISDVITYFKYHQHFVYLPISSLRCLLAF